MAKFDAQKYNMGKSRGMHIAYYTYKKYGLDYLEGDVELRKKTYVDADVSTNELFDISGQIYKCMFETVYIMSLYCLREVYGFGAKRAMRYTEKYTEIKHRLYNQPFHKWMEERDDTLKKLEINLAVGTRIKPRKDDYRDGRIAGFEYALKMIKEDKIDELEQTIKTNMKVKLPMYKMHQQSNQVTEYIEYLCYDTILTMVMKAVHEVFGYGKTKIDRLFKKWDETAYNLLPDMSIDVWDTSNVSWNGLIWVCENEMNIFPCTDWMMYRGVIEERKVE